MAAEPMVHSTPTTKREEAKARRRRQLLDAGARLIAQRGFRGVRLDDLGAAAGISGPAVYRHFPSKEALLVELLTGVSDQLLSSGRTIAESHPPAEAVEHLVDMQLDFALANPDLIRIQDRELENLPSAAKHRIRKAQRRYVEIWVGALRQVNPDATESECRTTAHAAFGLINSTPHSATSTIDTRRVLRRMTLAALRHREVSG